MSYRYAKAKLSTRRLLLLGLLFWTCALVARPQLPVKTEIGLIRIYQSLASPMVSKVATCRYRPTCSHYAIEALRQDGLLVGNARIAGRLAMCSPLGWVIDNTVGPEQ